MSKQPTLKEVVRMMVIKCLETKGFSEDRYGHWTKFVGGLPSERDYTIRYKFMDRVIRREIKVVGSDRWTPSRSAYYEHMTVENNKVVFKKRIGQLS